MIVSLLVLQILPSPADTDVSVRRVEAPRIDAAEVVVDGDLGEPAWARAAVLTGFSQYLPADGRPAADATEVLVWYEATAIYFGVRASSPPGSVRSTLADRDKIAGDDFVQILLDTFNAQREAYSFAVNPLGVQADGIVRDAARRAASFGSVGEGGGYTVDLSPDFVFESRGRVTDAGYEVEIRIPFKSLRYQPDRVQDWGINIIRKTQHSGHENTWSAVRQSDASFLAQSGALVGLTELHRGLVLDVNPEATSTVDGTPAARGWDYDMRRVQLGGNVRWGLTNNLFLNGTLNPDFSQVEADVAQVQFDPRRALFFPEKRPFFLDGIEQFETPNRLIYTRRVADPLTAVKVTGKVSGTNLAVLSAADGRSTSATGEDRPLINLIRVRRDIGGQSTLGAAYTDRIDGDDYNRVGAVDGRLVFGGSTSLTFQGGMSVDRRSGTRRTAPIWHLAFDRAGRRFGLSYSMTGLHPDFVAGSGFIARTGVVNASLVPRVTVLGRPGAAIESWTGSISLSGTWDYDRFVNGRTPNDPKLHFNSGFTLRGGWRLGASILLESFKYPEELYRNYFIDAARTGGVDTVPYTGTDRLFNLDLVASVATPQFQHFSGSLRIIAGRDENFFEWASANIFFVTLNADWRPTDQLRVNALYNHQQYIRPADWSTVGKRRIPRLKVEYQMTRSIFVRLVGQYDAQHRDSLRDNSRTEAPVLLFDPATETFERAGRTTTNDFRFDWLFSYQPRPGTVFFAGYGSTLTEPDAFRFRGLERVTDGFFVKLSYLFRM